MASSNSRKNFMAAGLLIFSALLMFLLISYFFDRYQERQSQPTIAKLTAEIEQLEANLQDVVEQAKDKDLDIEMRDGLLEEKNAELVFMGRKLQQLQREKADPDERTARLEMQLASARAMLREAWNALDKERDELGLVFRVQIGILEDESIPSFPFDAQMFLVEEIDDYQKYVIGSFREYEASLQFRDLLRKLGVKDAWVVTYHDGLRIDPSQAQIYETSVMAGR